MKVLKLLCRLHKNFDISHCGQMLPYICFPITAFLFSITNCPGAMLCCLKNTTWFHHYPLYHELNDDVAYYLSKQHLVLHLQSFHCVHVWKNLLFFNFILYKDDVIGISDRIIVMQFFDSCQSLLSWSFCCILLIVNSTIILTSF